MFKDGEDFKTLLPVRHMEKRDSRQMSVKRLVGCETLCKSLKL